MFLLQIGDLLNGRFSWIGLAQLLLLVAMGLIAVGFAVIVGYKAFQSKSKK
ncbi:MAG: hypothetical protein M3T96_00915 [Acidobacteriota bacterium]|nr:hypothetical protein [Acidobacteriota bacterium]